MLLVVNAVILTSTRSQQQQIHTMVRIRSLVELLTKVGGSSRRGRNCTVEEDDGDENDFHEADEPWPRSQELFGLFNCIGVTRVTLACH
jgi:hypothetical protein